MRSLNTFVLAGPSGSELQVGDVPMTIGAGEACNVRLHGSELAELHVRLAYGFVDAIEPCALGGVVLRAGARRKVIVPGALRGGDVALSLRRPKAIHPHAASR